MSALDIIARLGNKKTIHPVPTPEGILHVRALNGEERVSYFESISGEVTNSDKLKADHRVVAMQLCNEDGSPVFEDVEAGIQALLKWELDVLKPLADAIMKHSGLSADSQDNAAKK